MKPSSMRTTMQRLNALAREIWRQTLITARLAIGLPDYDTYLRHQRRHHAQTTPMSRDEFFRERQVARYGKGRTGCC